MIKKYLSSLLLLSLFSSVYAFNDLNFPEKFAINNFHCNTGGCVIITANNKRIGELSQALHQPGTFYFFDENYQKQITLKFRGEYNFHLDRYFDVFNAQGVLIAKLILRNDFNINYALKVYNKDGKKKLIHITAGMLGTTQPVYAADDAKVLATLTRPLFTLSADSAITILDKSKILADVDSNVLMTALSLYCTHFAQIAVAREEGPLTQKLLHDVHLRLRTLSDTQGLGIDNLKISSREVVAAANTLHQQYQKTYGENYFNDDTYLNKEDKLKQLVALGEDLILSGVFTHLEQQALLQYLIQQVPEFKEQ